MKNSHPSIEYFKKGINNHLLPAYIQFFEHWNRNFDNIISALEKTLSNKIKLQEESDISLLKPSLLAKIESDTFAIIEEHKASFEILKKFCYDSAIRNVSINDKLFEHSTLSINEPIIKHTISIKNKPLKTISKLIWNLNLILKKFWFRIANKINGVQQPSKCINYTRTIPLAQITSSFAFAVFPQSLLPILHEVLKIQSKCLITIWKLDEKLNTFYLENHLQNTKEQEYIEKQKSYVAEVFSEVKNDIELLKETVAKNIVIETDRVFNEFISAFNNVDNIDLSRKYFSEKNVLKKIEKTNREFIKTIDEWTNTQIALIDDWQVDIEITQLYFDVYNQYEIFKQSTEQFILNEIAPELTDIQGTLSSIQNTLSSSAKSKKEIREGIEQQRLIATNELIEKKITPLVEKISNCFDKDYDLLESNIQKLSRKISTEKSFKRGNNYNVPSAKKDIKILSPRDLISFEALPNLIYNIEKNKLLTNEILEKIRVNLMGLGTVCDYTLESSNLLLSETGNIEKVNETIFSGFKRTLTLLKNTETFLDEISSNINQSLNKAITVFDNEIQKLKNSDTLFELNLKIVKIKAKEQVKLFIENSRKFIQNCIPKIKGLISELMGLMNEELIEIKTKLGFKIHQKHVTFELSEFINRAHDSLNQLPYVYQRLYRLTPTNEDRFFVNREVEIKGLEKAFENWKKDRFITVALIAEKGTGTTSLINLFIEKNLNDFEIKRHTLNRKIYSRNLYLELFSQILDIEIFESNEQIIQHINNVEKPIVIVLENLQHMFIKRVHGFDCMNLFFELMANTMKKVLWIGAYTTHAWNYLEETIKISNYFTSEMEVKPMNQINIEEIIYKRNNLSGFQIVFEPSNGDKTNKKYLTLNEKDKVLYLKQKYFTALYRLSKGNVTLAQLIWLQSASIKNDCEINISSIIEFDFSFVNSLSNDELFAMQSLIIHDGLELDDFSLIMGKSIIASRNILTPMLEKGLLIKPNKKYNVNPIVFRTIVNFLVSRNFIN